MRNQHLEAQLSTMQEEGATCEALETLVQQLQRTVETSAARERELQETLDRLRVELANLRTHWGERRRSSRWRMPEIQVELSGAADSIFSGASRDVGSDGFGLETDQEVPTHAPLRARLRIPGAAEAIETDAQLVWQHHEAPASRYHSGFRLLNLAPEAQGHLARMLDRVPGIPDNG